MAEQLGHLVEEGLKIAKRINFGKDQLISPPQYSTMEKNSSSFIPTSPMVYAVISDPSIVDNPDIPSYQPHVHGRCDPSALIPLHMNEIMMEVNCYLDTAFITVTGSWRVHCIMRRRSCFCRLVVPMGEQGSVLGVEVDVSGTSYATQLIAMEEKMDMRNSAKAQVRGGGYLEPHIFTITTPKVEGGSSLSVKVCWSQKLVYNLGQFTLSVPFNFPKYVTLPGKGISRRQNIKLNVNYGSGLEVSCTNISHPMKNVREEVGRLACSYEADVLAWSCTDFSFSYAVSCKLDSSGDIFGRLLLHSPSLQDFDQREMFCFYLFPGDSQSKKVFRREVIFLVDISGSMQGDPLENVKNALSAALSKLNPEDSFSIIAFNEEAFLFSSSLEQATEVKIEKATQWMQINFVAAGGTNILQPITMAMELLSNSSNSNSIPLIFLITDGAVEDERQIYNLVRNQLTTTRKRFPRISTFGVGTYCNHYFLKMLALIGKGHYDVAYYPDSIDIRFQRLYGTASSVVLADITIDQLDHLKSIEVYPRYIPDVSSGSPLIISGRYKGEFPDTLEVGGFLADMSRFTKTLKAEWAKEIPLDKVLAKEQIDQLTAEAWFSNSKEVEEKVAKMSIHSSVPSEYTSMILRETDGEKQGFKSIGIQEVSFNFNPQKLVDSSGRKIILLRGLGTGFGNITATSENKPPRFGEPLLFDSASDPIVKAATSCCSTLCDNCCGICCIRILSTINNQCAIAISQLCTALACFGCLSCCAELCFD